MRVVDVDLDQDCTALGWPRSAGSVTQTISDGYPYELESTRTPSQEHNRLCKLIHSKRYEPAAVAIWRLAASDLGKSTGFRLTAVRSRREKLEQKGEGRKKLKVRIQEQDYSEH